MIDNPSEELTSRTRRHTGAVGLILTGNQPIPFEGREIVEVARSTEFSEEDHLTQEYDGWSVEYVPCALSSNAMAEALMQGRLLYKFTVIGNPPDEFSPLSAGTYYYYVDFVEGPDFDEGRWIGRIVDENGAVLKIIPGVEVKQVVSFHVDDQSREQHGKPEIHAHGLGVGEAALAISGGGGGPVSTDKWIVTKGDWVPSGNGCMRCFFCSPAPVVAFGEAILA